MKKIIFFIITCFTVIFTYSQDFGCTDEASCNFSATALINDGSCDYSCIGCLDPYACNYDETATIPDDSCEYTDCVGCMNPVACDYDPAATIQILNESFDADGNSIYTDACDYTSCAGCTDVNACNFGYTTQSADYSDDMLVDENGAIDLTGSPDAMIPSLDADGNIEYDLTGSEDETYTIWYAYDDGEPYAIIYTNDDYNPDYGMVITVPNPDYNPAYGEVTGDGIWDVLIVEDGSCEYETCAGCTVIGACDYDADATITAACDLSCLGCTDAGACNYSATAITDDGTCDYACIGCMIDIACNFDASYYIADNTMCTYDCHGCMQTDACNYDEAATYEPQGSCEWTSCLGCMDVTSCDYDPTATIPTNCDYDITDCFGCSDAGACNTLDAAWVIDDGSCDYACLGCTDNGELMEEQGLTIIVEGEEVPVYAADADGNPVFDADGNPIQQTEWVNVSTYEGIAACNYDPTATIDDGSCDYECIGCTDATACDYDPNATVPAECDYTDLDDCAGCTAPAACNYNPNATIDLIEGEVGSCEYTSCAGCMDVVGCDYDPTATISVECDYTCWGCTDPMACNYDVDSTIDDGTCSYICVGCADENACNYEGAIIDDGSCDYSCVGCMDMLACDYDASYTIEGDCDFSCWGCMDPLACNYNPDATQPNDSCDYSECIGCMDETACDYNPNATTPGDCVDWSSCVGCTEEGMYYDNLYWTPFTNYCETCTTDTYGNGYTQDNESASTNEFFAGDVVECIPLLSECGMCADGTLDCFNTIDWSGDPDEFIPCTDEDGVVIVITNEDGEEEVVWCDNPDYNVNYGELVGCMDWYAVNYDEDATAHDAEMCLYYIEGCMSADACNYDMEATEHMEDWCIYPDGICDTCSGETDGTGTIVDNDADDDTVCDVDDVCPGEDDTADADGDLIPDACDTCPNDAENDADGDGLCGDVDPCDYDAENDADGDGICGNVDDCPYDAENDADGDGICGDVDDCPYDEFNDADGDGVCGDVDACEGFDDAQDADGDGVPDACEVPGCTDGGYANFNPEATDDDGSCEVLCGCNTEDGYGLYGLAYSGTLDNAFTITNSAGDVVLSADFWVGESGYVNYCWPADDCYTVSVDGNTDAIGWNVYECLDCGLDGDCENNELYVVASSQGTADYEFGTCIDGCTDDTACNYNEEANSEDGSCCLVCDCMDSDADNYNPDACYDDGTYCIYSGCTDETAVNYDETANDDDGSCYFAPGCTDEIACNYDAAADFDDGSCEFARAWFLDLNGDGCGNECAGEFFDDVEGTISECESDLVDPVIEGWPNATWADNDNCHGEDLINADGVLEQHWCITGLEESISGLSIYPNPATDVLNIEFNSNSNDNVTIEFVNAIGQVISSDKFVVTNGLLDIELDMNGYSKGVYQINLISDTDVLSRTIMVE
jgi:hypothetical protein